MKLLCAPPQPPQLKAKYEPRIKCASHLGPALNPEKRRTIIDNLIRVLKYHDFDAIAFRGLSGALIAPTVAMEMDKTLLAVRKPEENRHSEYLVEGDYNARRYVIVDDMISMGTTVYAILHAIHDEMPTAECLGVVRYLYLNDECAPLTAVEPITDWLFGAKWREPETKPKPQWTGAIQANPSECLYQQIDLQYLADGTVEKIYRAPGYQTFKCGGGEDK